MKPEPIAIGHCFFKHAHDNHLIPPMTKNYWARGTKLQRRDYALRQAALYGKWFAESNDKLMLAYYEDWRKKAIALSPVVNTTTNTKTCKSKN